MSVSSKMNFNLQHNSRIPMESVRKEVRYLTNNILFVYINVWIYCTHSLWNTFTVIFKKYYSSIFWGNCAVPIAWRSWYNCTVRTLLSIFLVHVMVKKIDIRFFCKDGSSPRCVRTYEFQLLKSEYITCFGNSISGTVPYRYRTVRYQYTIGCHQYSIFCVRYRTVPYRTIPYGTSNSDSVIYFLHSGTVVLFFKQNTLQ